MLRTLRVTDLAIIEELELVFEPGLNALTGETGAGKSILLHALDVALGGRADADLVRGGADEAVVEALFTDLAPGVGTVLKAYGVDDARDELIIRRVVSRSGRTRAHVNGAMGSVALLHDLAPHVLHVYGQDEHQALRRVESHRELLDAIGGLGTTVLEMRERHSRMAAARQALADARAEASAAAERTELLQFQLQELERAQLSAGEEDQLATERRRLMGAEKLASLVTGVEAGLYSGEQAVVDALSRAVAALREAERLDAALGATRGMLEQALAEVQETAAALVRYAGTINPDPDRLDTIEARLAELGRLKRKYGGTVEELVRRRQDLVHELAGGPGQLTAVEVLEADAAAAERRAVEWARKLSVERRRVAHQLERSLATELRSLALEGARFAVRFGEAEGKALGPDGFDEVEFFLSANPGEDLRPLTKVASGGELSRIMLALKSLAAAEDREATLIFDEVDAGIGGAVAEVVAKKLRHLGRKRQVLCVTHLPIIAAFGEHHIGVVKRVVDGRTVSTARPLGTTERVAELARMLGGARITREAQDHAEQMLRQAAGKGGKVAASA
ncbi:MAG: DNA repair protein RecN [Candidatus Binatia bacterium]